MSAISLTWVRAKTNTRSKKSSGRPSLLGVVELALVDLFQSLDVLIRAVKDRRVPQAAVAIFAYAMLRQMATTSDGGLLLGDAARALGVSPTRYGAGSGPAGSRHTETAATVGVSVQIERLARRPARHRAGDTLSARNRFPGVVRSVEADGVMALVEIEAGPHRITAAVTRDAVGRLGLAAGVPATAAVDDLGDDRKGGRMTLRGGRPGARLAGGSRLR